MPTKAHPLFRGDGLRSNPTSDPRRALPRTRTLCTNSKNPRYSGNFSCEIPRCGRSQLRSNDQNPSSVLTCTSQNPSPSSSRANSPAGRMADRLVMVTQLIQATVNGVLVCVNDTSWGDHPLDQGTDGGLLDILQHPDDHLAGALQHPEDRGLLLG